MKPTEVAGTNIPKAESHEVMVMQENEALVPLIRAARGEIQLISSFTKPSSFGFVRLKFVGVRSQ
jgi:hypothetical protein